MKRLADGRSRPSPEFQTLEARRMLAVFGNAWPEPRDLTISFPVDGVELARYQNDINATLDAIATRQDWQELALRAYQTWAVHADLNIGLRNDYNTDFGVPGRIVGDPRFGEFRIGAFPSAGLVANSVPFQAVAGTYSGDLILNSADRFTFHDWTTAQPPDPQTIAEGDRDLFSVLLHEAGNTLGLDDNLLSWSVMFRHYTVPKGVLSAEDIAGIQSLYGARSDPYELVDNGQLQQATLIETPTGFDPTQEVLRTRGSLSAGTDLDHYKLVPLAGHDRVTLRLRASGVSLLQSRLEIVDASGQVLQNAASASVFDNDSVLTVDGLQNYSELYLRIAPLQPGDIYAIGDYWLEVDYRDAVVRAADYQPGNYDAGPDALFSGFGLADPESGENDLLSQFDPMAPSVSLPGQRFELEGSVSSAADVDYLRVTAPGTIEGRLLVHLAGVGANLPSLKLRVVDASGQPVGTSGVLRDNGTFTVEVAQPVANQDYYLKVSVDPSSTVGAGNYIAVAEFETAQTQMNALASGTVTEQEDVFLRWTAHKSKLFRFDLAVTSAHANQAVRLTLYDAHTREIKAIAVGHAGATRALLSWLEQGEYILRFHVMGVGNAEAVSADYTLTADGISDDQDEDPYDPIEDPSYAPYDYTYEYSPYYYDPVDPYYGYSYDTDFYYYDPYYYDYGNYGYGN